MSVGDPAAKRQLPFGSNVALSARTVTRRIVEIAEDIDMQLLQRINKSPWNALQVDESTVRQYYLAMCDILIRRMCMRICYVHYLC